MIRTEVIHTATGQAKRKRTPLNKILYVEDDKIDQLAFEGFVKANNLPFDCKIVSSVAAARKILSEENFDAVLLDYNLGDGTGFDVFSYVKNQAPIIFITSENDVKNAVKGMKAGAYDYLIKDLDREYLQLLPSTLEKAIGHNTVKQRLASAEKEIKKLSWAISKTNNGVMIADRFGKIFWVNEGFSHLTGYALAEVEGTSGEILMKGGKTGLSPGSVHYERLMKEKRAISYEEKKHSKDDREFWVMCSLTPALDEAGEVEEIIVVYTDITKIKRIEEDLLYANRIASSAILKSNQTLRELQKAKEQVERVSKIKEQFMANMSHEIRTPMNGIIGLTEIILKSDLNEEQKEYLDTIRTSGETLMVVINDLLDISKMEAGKMTFEEIPFSIEKITHSLLDLFLMKAREKNILLEKSIGPGVPKYLIGDRLRLNQILMNLVSNAVKFTQQGRVLVSADVKNEDDQGALIEFSVRDTGIGIPENKIPSLFLDFAQASAETARKFGGTGLGLAIAKRLVELQGGTIEVISKEGAGTEFRINIEYKKCKNIEQVDEEILRREKEEEMLSEFELKNSKILLVEDNAMNQMVSKKLLTDWGCVVDIAENGREAIEKLKQNKYNVVLMDIIMPDMDGYEAAEYIRTSMGKDVCNVPIIALTAHAATWEVEKCLGAGMNDYISKPFKSHDLYKKIVRQINRKVN